MNNQIIFYAATLLTAVLGLIIGAVAYSYRKLINKYYALKEDLDLRDKEGKLQADKIIQEAQARANIILQESQAFQTLLKQNLDKQLITANQSYNNSYQNILSTVKEESIKNIGNISQEIKTEISIEIDQVINSLKEEMIKSQASAIESLKLGLAKSEQDIKLYKDEMYKKIDQSVLKIIQTVSYQVIGKSINLEDHEELVIKALTSAKRQGII